LQRHALLNSCSFRATRSDAEQEEQGPSRSQVRIRSKRHSQERFRPSLRGLNGIETVIEDETAKQGGIGIPPDSKEQQILLTKTLLALGLSQLAVLWAIPSSGTRCAA
jgi:hypothetical protein